MVVGLFAIPEIVDLAVRGTSIAGGKTGKLTGVMDGVKDTFRHFWLVVRCSLIGVYFGVLPVLGANVAQWISYAHAVSGLKDKSQSRQRRHRGPARPRRGEQFHPRRRPHPDNCVWHSRQRRHGSVIRRHVDRRTQPRSGNAQITPRRDVFNGLGVDYRQSDRRRSLFYLSEPSRVADLYSRLTADPVPHVPGLYWLLYSE